MKSCVFLVSALALSFNCAFACPAIGRLPDFNCNGHIDITVLGDSLVAGVGDKQRKGGYVARAKDRLAEAAFYNYGVPGETSLQLIRKLQREFSVNYPSTFVKNIVVSDIIFLDTGRNDRWLNGPPLATYRNLQRARQLIEDKVFAESGHRPLIVTAVLTLPNRVLQEPWVRQLNNFLIKSNSSINPADLRFDKVSKSLLSADNLHPAAAGYRYMADVLVNYLLTNYVRSARKLRPDRDQDLLYDEYEEEVFGTSPDHPDSDFDGLLDGEDIQPLAGILF
jgi:lysophospholipase L1-like esterase